MAELKTKQTSNSVKDYIENINDKGRKEDAIAMVELLKRATSCEPVMWGEKIVGFGNFHYKYSSGREGDWFLAGFSSAKTNLTVYLMAHGLDIYDELFQKLGKHKKAKGCIYLKRLEDINTDILVEIIKAVIKDVSKFSK